MQSITSPFCPPFLPARNFPDSIFNSGSRLDTQISVSSNLILCYSAFVIVLKKKSVDSLFLLFYLAGENEKSCGWSIEKKIELLESSAGKVQISVFHYFAYLGPGKCQNDIKVVVLC